MRLYSINVTLSRHPSKRQQGHWNHCVYARVTKDTNFSTSYNYLITTETAHHRIMEPVSIFTTIIGILNILRSNLVSFYGDVKDWRSHSVLNETYWKSRRAPRRIGRRDGWSGLEIRHCSHSSGEMMGPKRWNVNSDRLKIRWKAG